MAMKSFAIKPVAGAIGVYFTVSAATYYYFKGRKDDPDAAEATAAAAATPGGAVGECSRRDSFSRQAKCYDDQVGFDETLMGMTLLR